MRLDSVIDCYAACLSLTSLYMGTLCCIGLQFGYVVGATSVSLPTYTVATFLGLLPGCVLYAWIGAAAGSGEGWSSVISIAISVVSTLAISFKAKQLVDEALARSGQYKAHA